MTTTAQLCVAHVNSDMGFSGGEVQVFLTVEGLRALGHRPVLYCQPGSWSARQAAQRDLEWVPVRMRNDLDLAAIISLARGFRRRGAHLVHLHSGRANWLGGIAAWAERLPAITTRRMDRRVKRNWRTRLIYERFTKCAVAISPAVSACLIDAGVRPERVRLIYDAVDATRLQPSVGREPTRAALGAGPDDRVLLTLAALIHRKGLDVLLDALAQLRAAGLRPLLWIAGDGPERAALGTQAERLGLREQVRFLAARSDAADLLAACDLFVLPSRREGLGVAALEAMAAGRAVVCSAVGGLQHAVVDGRTGLLFPPGDAHALSRTLARLLQNDDLRTRLGQAGPARIGEGFLAEQMVDAYQQLYREVMHEWDDDRSCGAPREP